MLRVRVRRLKVPGYMKGRRSSLLPANHALPSRERGSLDPRAVGTALALLAAGSLYLARSVHWRQAALLLVGGAAGVTLYHAAFGFTSAWRVLISDRRGAGLRAQMLMLAVACVLFFPVLAGGESLLGQPVRGAVAPLSLSVVIGAFMFGVGMQLGGG